MPVGAFISLEGGEGVGKSTSLSSIENFLTRRGIPLLITREPGGTPLGESIRSWILDGQHENLSANVEAMLMFAARSQHLDQVIRPALAAGTWVVCDRFTDATIAYQGGGRGANPAFLQALQAEVQQGLTPDLTILLDAPVDVGFARIADRPHDHFERESAEFFERVRRTYLNLAEQDPQRFRVIDASASPETVHASIERELAAFCLSFAEPAAVPG